MSRIVRISVFGLGLIGSGLVLGQEQGYGPLIQNGLDEQLAIGADLFFSETFEGNGRTCGTCHEVENNYTLPADLSGRDDQDPLMVGDPDNPNPVFQLELCDSDCVAIREKGLILVNADRDGNGVALDGPDGAPSYTMRAIPHTLSLSTTIDDGTPGGADATGWSGDGSPNDRSLFQFPAGAVAQHFTLDTDRDLEMEPPDFRLPTNDELAAMEAFQLALGRQNEINLASITFRHGNANTGRDIFNETLPNAPQNSAGRCSFCHANAGALTFDDSDNANFNTGIEQRRIDGCPDASAAGTGKCAEDSASIVPGGNRDGGFGIASMPDGRWGDGRFNTVSLIEAADTPPFFHDNSNIALEGAIAFYNQQTFLDQNACGSFSPCGLEDIPGEPLTLGEENFLGAMLRTLNSGFNVSMAAQRIRWAAELVNRYSADHPSVMKTLELAREEVEDARSVLSVRDNPNVFGGSAPGNNSDEQARMELVAIRNTLDGYLAQGYVTGGSQLGALVNLTVLIGDLIAVSEDHLSDDYYAEQENPTRCTERGVTVGTGYHNCRWIYDMAAANVIFDNSDVGPGLRDRETEMSIVGLAGSGTNLVTMKWETEEWTNRLVSSAVLSHDSPNPAFAPITIDPSISPLAGGGYEYLGGAQVPCTPRAKYRLEVRPRVGGVTEVDVVTAKGPSQCQ